MIHKREGDKLILIKDLSTEEVNNCIIEIESKAVEEDWSIDSEDINWIGSNYKQYKDDLFRRRHNFPRVLLVKTLETHYDAHGEESDGKSKYEVIQDDGNGPYSICQIDKYYEWHECFIESLDYDDESTISYYLNPDNMYAEDGYGDTRTWIQVVDITDENPFGKKDIIDNYNNLKLLF